MKLFLNGDKMLNTLIHDNKKIQIEVVYRKRKTMEIQVIPPGKVRVVAPKGVSDRFIQESFKNKASWILEKLAEVKAKEELIPKHRYIDGETFLFLGREVILRVFLNARIKKPQVRMEKEASLGTHKSLIIETPILDKVIIKGAMENWYKKQAEEIFAKRVTYYADKMGKKPEKLKLSNAKKRWGSCTSKGTILINWRMVMAPLWVLDYLVVHEMSHLFQLNHAKSFWRLVGEVIPDYKKARDWLKENGYRMVL